MPKPIVAVPSAYVTKAALTAFREKRDDYPATLIAMTRGDGNELRTPLYDKETVDGLIAEIERLDAKKFKADNERLRRENDRLSQENDALQHMLENDKETKEVYMKALKWATIMIDLDEEDGDRRGIAHAAHEAETELLKMLKKIVRATGVRA